MIYNGYDSMVSVPDMRITFLHQGSFMCVVLKSFMFVHHVLRVCTHTVLYIIHGLCMMLS